MFEIIKNIFTGEKSQSVFTIVISLVILILGFRVYFLKDNLQECKDEKKNLTFEIATLESNNLNLKNTITRQNETIQNNKIELDKKMNEFEIWKHKPVEVKYKEIIKYEKVKSNECEDIKNLINDIRDYSF